MSLALIVTVVIAVFFLLLACETPIALSLMASGALGLVLLEGTDIASAALGSLLYSVTSSYTLSTVTTFVLLGMLVYHAQIAERLYRLGSLAFGRFQAGLGIATVAACAGFAAVSGSSAATSATIGKLSISEMVRAGYPDRLAAGIVCGAGTLGILIPPSIMMVIYGIVAEVSISGMLLAGIVPGIITATVMGVYIAIIAQRVVVPPDVEDAGLAALLTGQAASGASEKPRGDESGRRATDDTGVPSPRTHGFQMLRAVLWVVVIFLTVMAGVFTGTFTVVESGAMGALVAFLVLLIEGRHGGLRSLLRSVGGSLRETASLVGMIFAILAGAAIFTQFLVLGRLPLQLANALANLTLSPRFVVIIVLLALIPLGMMLDSLAIVLIVVPLVSPAIEALGFSPVWFGILFIKMMEVGLATPPVGINGFVVSGASGVPVERVFRGVMPFIGLDLLTVAILFAFPDLVLWLPERLG